MRKFPSRTKNYEAALVQTRDILGPFVPAYGIATLVCSYIDEPPILTSSEDIVSFVSWGEWLEHPLILDKLLEDTGDDKFAKARVAYYRSLKTVNSDFAALCRLWLIGMLDDWLGTHLDCYVHGHRHGWRPISGFQFTDHSGTKFAKVNCRWTRVSILRQTSAWPRKTSVEVSWQTNKDKIKHSSDWKRIKKKMACQESALCINEFVKAESTTVALSALEQLVNRHNFVLDQLLIHGV